VELFKDSGYHERHQPMVPVLATDRFATGSFSDASSITSIHLEGCSWQSHSLVLAAASEHRTSRTRDSK